MKKQFLGRAFFTLITLILTCSGSAYADSYNITPPAATVPLIFIHHSVGENWLNDENGQLGLALRDNNYFVSDTNYGWGPEGIGDYTDIGHFWLWFRGPQSSSALSALYNEKTPHSTYSRLGTTPADKNAVILFKSCFYSSALQGNPNDPIPSIDENPLKGEGSGDGNGAEFLTVANAKGIYLDLLEYFKTKQDKLFILITPPPLRSSTYASNARALNNWLVTQWLNDYPYHNVAVFDLYTVMTSNGGNTDTNDLNGSKGNHHRYQNGMVEHTTTSGSNTLSYPTEDDHPSMAGNLKATGEFLPILNLAYHCWKGDGACLSKNSSQSCSATASAALTLQIPFINSNGLYYTAQLAPMPSSDGALWFALASVQAVSTPSCTNAATFNAATGMLTIPSVVYEGVSYYAEFQYFQGTDGQATFKLGLVKKN